MLPETPTDLAYWWSGVLNVNGKEHHLHTPQEGEMAASWVAVGRQPVGLVRLSTPGIC